MNDKLKFVEHDARFDEGNVPALPSPTGRIRYCFNTSAMATVLSCFSPSTLTVTLPAFSSTLT
ncbi:MAG TPA: hypothetical protein VN476_00815, partial [Pyrinomonadaceae bacterium]|nr:hypothetical protein [Pyrinomonadaceae bacterium]